MITKEQITKILEAELIDTDIFIVDIRISGSNVISVLLDSDTAVTIEHCVKYSRLIENGLNRDAEDFELTVSSVGATAPLQQVRQYVKNTGRMVAVTLPDGTKYKGRLTEASETSFTLEFQTKEKVEGKKKKQTITHTPVFSYEDVKTVKVILEF